VQYAHFTFCQSSRAVFQITDDNHIPEQNAVFTLLIQVCAVVRYWQMFHAVWIILEVSANNNNFIYVKLNISNFARLAADALTI